VCISATQAGGPTAVDQPLTWQPTLSHALNFVARSDNRAILAEVLAGLPGTCPKDLRGGRRKRAITVVSSDI
jgi:hypothetical protein